MSKKPTTALTVVQRAVAALGYNVETTQELTTLAEKHKTIVTITNDDGREQANRARLDLRAARLEVSRRGKLAREDATAYSKAVIAEETRLVALVEPEEDRLAKLVDEFDAAAEAAQARKVEAELARVEALKERVAELRGNQLLTIHDGSELIAEHLRDLDSIVVDAAFEEYEQQASDAKTAGMLRLAQLFSAAKHHEAEQARLKAEAAAADQLRRENEQLRAEKAERDRKDREAAEQRERDAQAGRDEIARVERIRQENERKAQEPAVTRETTVERAPAAVMAPLYSVRPLDIDTGPLAGETVLLVDEPTTDAQLASLQQQADVTPTIVENLGGALITHIGDERPGFEEIVRAVARHFETDEATVRGWITDVAAVRGFIGYLSADVPALGATEIPELAASWDRFCSSVGRVS